MQVFLLSTARAYPPAPPCVAVHPPFKMQPHDPADEEITATHGSDSNHDLPQGPNSTQQQHPGHELVNDVSHDQEQDSMGDLTHDPAHGPGQDLNHTLEHGVHHGLEQASSLNMGQDLIHGPEQDSLPHHDLGQSSTSDLPQDSDQGLEQDPNHNVGQEVEPEQELAQELEPETDPSSIRVIMYSAMPHEIAAFKHELCDNPEADLLDVVFVSSRLDYSTVTLSYGAQAVSLFATDNADPTILEQFRNYGVGLIALRYAGVSSVDVAKAAELKIRVTRVPAHAPTSIAEYTVTMMLALNRKIHVGSNRARDGNFDLQGLVGFDMSEKTIGIIGTGKVGRIVARILSLGFESNVIACDMVRKGQLKAVGGKYVSFAKLLETSDIISLHAPLVPGTHHMLGRHTLPRCKAGVHIINSSRGGLLDVKAVIEGLRTGHVGGLALDVYEGESNMFYKDNTGELLDFDFQILKSMPNVLITAHQASLTRNALMAVAQATVKSLIAFKKGAKLEYMHHLI